MEKQTGKLVTKRSGYGFINDGKGDYFFHKNELKNGYFNSLVVGQVLYFEPDYNSPKGPNCKAVYTNIEGMDEDAKNNQEA